MADQWWERLGGPEAADDPRSGTAPSATAPWPATAPDLSLSHGAQPVRHQPDGHPEQRARPPFREPQDPHLGQAYPAPPPYPAPPQPTYGGQGAPGPHGYGGESFDAFSGWSTERTGVAPTGAAPAPPGVAPGPGAPVTPSRRSLRHGAGSAAPVEPRHPDATAADATAGELVLDVRTVRRTVWAVIGFLIVMDFVVALAAGLGLLPYTITRFFDGDSKVNFPTGAKTTLLLSTTVLTLVCWRLARRSDPAAGRAWLMLAATAGFAFVDETTYLHQTLSEALQKAFHLTGVLKYSWTLVYAPIALVVGIFLIRGLQLIPRTVRPGLIGGGACFAAGAVLLEPVKSKLSDSLGDGSTTFRLTAACSDSLELVGLALLSTSALAAVGVLAPRVVAILRGAPATRD